MYAVKNTVEQSGSQTLEEKYRSLELASNHFFSELNHSINELDKFSYRCEEIVNFL